GAAARGSGAGRSGRALRAGRPPSGAPGARSPRPRPRARAPRAGDTARRREGAGQAVPPARFARLAAEVRLGEHLRRPDPFASALLARHTGRVTDAELARLAAAPPVKAAAAAGGGA